MDLLAFQTPIPSKTWMKMTDWIIKFGSVDDTGKRGFKCNDGRMANYNGFDDRKDNLDFNNNYDMYNIQKFFIILTMIAAIQFSICESNKFKYLKIQSVLRIILQTKIGIIIIII